MESRLLTHHNRALRANLLKVSGDIDNVGKVHRGHVTSIWSNHIASVDSASQNDGFSDLVSERVQLDYSDLHVLRGLKGLLRMIERARPSVTRRGMDLPAIF